ncbi:MAG: HipA N-terminal domain-containing protein [Bacteroidota bacterium]
MRKAAVYRNKILVGYLTEDDEGNYLFEYAEDYRKDNTQSPVSLTLPKTRSVHQSNHLFPFFYNMLSEGVNRELQIRQLQLGENDHFGLLLATAQQDTIGAVTIEKVET